MLDMQEIDRMHEERWICVTGHLRTHYVRIEDASVRARLMWIERMRFPDVS